MVVIPELDEMIVPLQVHFGWRASFYVFGILGACWAAGWWHWYRNSPQEIAGITVAELGEIGPPAAVAVHALPSRAIGSNRSL